MHPVLNGLSTIEEERSMTPAQWCDCDSSEDGGMNRSVPWPLMDNCHRFFPKVDEEGERPRRSSQKLGVIASPLTETDKALQLRQMEKYGPTYTQVIEKKLHQRITENRKLEDCLREKDCLIHQLRLKIDEMKAGRKIIKIKDRKQPLHSRQHPHLRQPQALLEGAQNDSKTLNSEELAKKVRHLENERKYEQDRIQSATLSLELDLKIKDKQIERLQHQLTVYQRKFEQILQKQVEKPLQAIEGPIQQKTRLCGTEARESYPNLKEDSEERKTLSKQGRKGSSQRAHGRTGSFNLEEHPRRRGQVKVALKIEPRFLYKVI